MHGHEADPTDQPRTIGEGMKNKPWSILALLSVAQFMVILDVTVVNVALPVDRHRLSASRRGICNGW